MVCPFDNFGLNGATFPSSPILKIFFAAISLKKTSPFSFTEAFAVVWYPSETSCQSSPGIRVSFCVWFCELPMPTLLGQSFHNQRSASGKIAVACLPLCAPSPHTWFTSVSYTHL